ncbi:MAG: radical SAM protein [Elusimicrobia bacterium]|nr:radical SAM protein [Elusimicrobiota bacterium]
MKARLTGKRVPFQLNMHITDVCNLRCKYCYIDFDHAVPDMSLETMKDVISQARACGTERISLEGGEPLVRRDIGELVDHIASVGIDCNINTNGYYLPRKIGELKRVGTISVSMDGPRDVHDALRGPGSYDKAIAAIEAARGAGIKVHVLSVLTKANRPHVRFMVDLAKTMGFMWIPTSLFFMAGVKIDREAAGAFKIEDEDYKALMRELIQLKAEGAPIAWSNRTLKYVRDWPTTYFQSNFFNMTEEYVMKEFKPLQCQASRHFCVMQTNGDLYSCDPLLGYGKAQNAVELGFKEAFERTSQNGCIACNSLVCSEYHSLFTMNVPVIMNLLTQYAKRG